MTYVYPGRWRTCKHTTRRNHKASVQPTWVRAQRNDSDHSSTMGCGPPGGRGGGGGGWRCDVVEGGHDGSYELDLVQL